MYIAKFTKHKIVWEATLLKKEWSSELNSNHIVSMDSKKFIFYFFAKQWIRNKIIKDLVKDKKMEIIDGRS